MMLVLLCATGSVGAHAATLNLHFDDGDDVTGTIEATDNGDGSWTAVSGSISGYVGSYTLLPNPNAPNPVLSPIGFFEYDNQLFPAGHPHITTNGLGFIDAAGETEVVIRWRGAFESYELYAYGAYSYGSESPGTLSLVPVPEPASLIALSLGAVASTRRLKKK